MTSKCCGRAVSREGGQGQGQGGRLTFVYIDNAACKYYNNNKLTFKQTITTKSNPCKTEQCFKLLLVGASILHVLRSLSRGHAIYFIIPYSPFSPTKRNTHTHKQKKKKKNNNRKKKSSLYISIYFHLHIHQIPSNSRPRSQTHFLPQPPSSSLGTR